MLKPLRRVFSGVGLALLACTSFARELPTVSVAFHIEPQLLPDALNAWAQQAGVQLVWRANATGSHQMAPRVVGAFTPQVALQSLLQASGFTYSFVDEETVAIRAESSVRARRIAMTTELNDADQTALETDVRRFAAAERIVGPAVPTKREAEGDVSTGAGDILAEVVVTGTHIRGAKTSSSPVVVLTRSDIQSRGQVSTEALLQTVTQNFTGAITNRVSGPVFAGEDSGTNYSAGSAVNLRGLGNGATLILLNGRRLAPAGAGNFVDVSMIPLSAIERIEILTDGASAIYGSDAIAGVVNVILRKEYEGAETHLAYGSVTDGSREEIQAGQLFGRSWRTGSGLVTYNYSDTSALSASDRDFTAGLPSPTDVLPRELKRNLLMSLNQTIADRASIYADALYADRHTTLKATLADAGTRDVTPIEAEQYGVVGGMQWLFASEWQADIAGTYNKSRTDTIYIQDGLRAGTFEADADIASLDASADGALFPMPGGDAHLALGAHYRTESYNSQGNLNPTVSELSRDVYAGFVEFFVPLVNPDDERAGFHRLDLTVAARYEHYSDFGSTTNPKVGLTWSLSPSFSLRGTYGRSFRAPLLSNLDERAVDIVAFPFPDISGGTTNTIFESGGRSNLGPERATSWSAGFDFKGVDLGIEAHATFFDIHFTDRISTPIPVQATFDALIDPTYAPFVNLAPSRGLVDSLFAHPSFSNPFDLTPDSIGAIIDERLTNVAVRNQQGIDFALAYTREFAGGEASFSFSSTYLLELEDRVTTRAPYVSVMNTTFYPVDFRMQNGIRWSKDRFSSALYVNYTDGYRDTGVTPAARVNSWTTVDLTLAYHTGPSFRTLFLRNTDISLSAQNLFDQNPPFIAASDINLVNYDAANASPLNRFISVQLRKAW